MEISLKEYIEAKFQHLEELLKEKDTTNRLLLNRTVEAAENRFATLELLISEKSKTDLQAVEKSTIASQERIQALEKLVDVKTAADRIAITKASDAVDERLRGMNEFRQTLSDQTNTFITRNEAHLTDRAMSEKIEALQKIVYVGLGALAVLQFLLQFLIPSWVK